MNTEPTIRWDDVVFENRNKTYGAYIIRKSYHSNLSRSTTASLLFCAVLFVGTRAMMTPGTHLNIIPKPPSDGLILKPPPQIITDVKIERTVSKPQPTIKDLPPRVVTTPIVDPPPIEIQQSLPGDDKGTNIIPSGDIGFGVSLSSPPVIVEQPKTVDIAEVMPEFEGGMKAFYKFLRKNLHYPSSASAIGIEGTVFVRFVVNVDGNVTNVEVIKSITGVLDKEASRVISILPKWKPGRQHDRPVNVRMVMPIKFELNN